MKTLQLNIILAVAAVVSAIRGLRLAANVYDAAVQTNESSVRRTNDAAVAARHLLWKKGAGDRTVAVCGANEVPLGTIDNIETGTAEGQTVLLLGKGPTKKMVALAAITAGAKVYTAAGGKVQVAPAGATVQYVGVALTAAGNADEIIEVADCNPITTIFA